jgi:hypothetical protein
MFDIDLDEFKTGEPELRDLTCDEIKYRIKKLTSAIEDAYGRNWLQPDEHELQDPEPVFDSEQFADDMTDIMFNDELGAYWNSIVGGFQDLADE